MRNGISKKNGNNEKKLSMDDFIKIYNQLNAGKRKLVDQMIMDEYTEQIVLSKKEDFNGKNQ